MVIGGSIVHCRTPILILTMLGEREMEMAYRYERTPRSYRTVP
jgi:hypothetical protein